MIGFQPQPSAVVRFSITGSHRKSTVSEHGSERSQMAWDFVISDFRCRQACAGGEKGDREQFGCHGHSMRAGPHTQAADCYTFSAVTSWRVRSKNASDTKRST